MFCRLAKKRGRKTKNVKDEAAKDGKSSQEKIKMAVEKNDFFPLFLLKT